MKRIRAYSVELVMLLLLINIGLTVLMFKNFSDYRKQSASYYSELPSHDDIFNLQSSLESDIDNTNDYKTLEDIVSRLKDLQDAAGIPSY